MVSVFGKLSCDVLSSAKHRVKDNAPISNMTFLIRGGVYVTFLLLVVLFHYQVNNKNDL